MNAVRFAPTPGTIAEQLRLRLLSLDYPAFARCACKLLEALGYEEARPAGRREWKGYNRPGGGGYDLEAVLPGGLVPRRIVVQLKHYDAPSIHQRNVDELRGACLRAGGAEALLITTSSFSKVVRNSQANSRQAASQEPENAQGVPVRLIDGQELLGLLIRCRLGVRERIRGGTRRLEIDEAFFSRLETHEAFFRGITASGSIASGNIMTRGNATFSTIAAPLAATPLNESSLPPRWRVTIRISTDFGPGPRSNDPAENNLPEDGQPEGGR